MVSTMEQITAALKNELNEPTEGHAWWEGGKPSEAAEPAKDFELSQEATGALLAFSLKMQQMLVKAAAAESQSLTDHFMKMTAQGLLIAKPAEREFETQDAQAFLRKHCKLSTAMHGTAMFASLAPSKEYALRDEEVSSLAIAALATLDTFVREICGEDYGKRVGEALKFAANGFNESFKKVWPELPAAEKAELLKVLKLRADQCAANDGRTE